MDAEQPHDFNDRLSQWIASQGFWFQLKYSMSGGGGWSIAMFHLMKIAVRVLLLALVVAGGFAIYLGKRIETESFRDGLRDKFVAATDANDAEISGFERTDGEAKIRMIGAEGSPTSFFQTLEAGNLSFKMGLFDGLGGDWDAGIIEGNWLDLHVKAGANSAEDAKAAAESLFRMRPGFEVLGLNFSSARVSWGYNERLGEIEDSKMSANRVSDGWRFQFKGGTFSQNWLRNFEIEEIVMLCTPSRLIVERGVLLAGEGRIDFKDVVVEGGELPEVSGQLVLANVPVERLIPGKIASRVGGTLSAVLELSGSTNSAAGIAMKGRVDLADRDMVQIRDEFPILEALDVVDVYNSYKRIVFGRGGFGLSTGSGELRISGLDLESKDSMRLEGDLTVRYPTSAEAAEAIGENATDLLHPLIRDDEEDAALRKITLKRAAEERKREMEEDEDDVEATEFFAELASKRDMEMQRRSAAQRVLGMLKFEGDLVLSVPVDAFERSVKLQERYPIDQKSGRVRIEVPIQGTLSELTLKQAEEILRDGRKGD